MTGQPRQLAADFTMPVTVELVLQAGSVHLGVGVQPVEPDAASGTFGKLRSKLGRGPALVAPGPAAHGVRVSVAAKDPREAPAVALVEQVSMSFAESTGVLRVEVPTIAGRRQPPLRVRITVPVGSSLTAESAAAEIVVAGTLASADVRSDFGGVHFEGVAGTTDVRTVSGAVTGHLFGGPVSIRGGAGVLVLRNCQAPVRLVTTSGDADIWFTTSDVQTQTVSGVVRIGVPHSAVLEVSANTGTGRVEVPALQPVAENLTADSAVAEPEGAAAAPPIRIDSSSVSGDVIVARTTPIGRT